MSKKLAALGTVLLAAAPVHAAERSYNVAGFDEIEVAGPYNVAVATGRAATVRATGETRDLDEMRVTVAGGKLQIRPRDRNWKMWRNTKPVSVRVTVPTLRAAALAGSGDISVDRVRGERFSGSVGGSGDLSVGTIDVRTLELSIAGSGNIATSGRCDAANVSIVGSGDIAAADLRCETADVSVAGSGDATIHASRSADISIMGSGDVAVAGGAKCEVSRMGSGRARCGR